MFLRLLLLKDNILKTTSEITFNFTAVPLLDTQRLTLITFTMSFQGKRKEKCYCFFTDDHNSHYVKCQTDHNCYK